MKHIASSNTMDTTLSEAPNLLSNRPVLTPALVSEQAFFLFRDRETLRREEKRFSPPMEARRALLLRVVLQG
jgi:hypothetical protein